MKSEVWIGTRLQPTKASFGRRGPSRVGVVIAVAGVALALAIMMVSLAVLNGFSDEIRNKVAEFEPQITITAINEDNLQLSMAAWDEDAQLTYKPISLTPEIVAALEASLPNGYKANVAAMRPAILKTDSDFQGLILRTEQNDSSKNSIRISRITAERLSLEKGDALTACFFIENESSPMKIRKLKVDSIYDTGFGDYDEKMAFVPNSLIASIDGLEDNEGSRIEITNISPELVEAAANKLREALTVSNYDSPGSTNFYNVETINKRGAMYFNWLEMLDTNVTVILILMGVVAAFTLISSMFVIVLERVRMIGLLKALGATNGFVRRIFVTILSRIVVRGLIIGNILAAAIIVVQQTTEIMRLDPATYFIDHVVMKISIWEILTLNLGVLIMAILVLILPSRVICGISPSRSLRFE